jgi:hypothetical protein
VGPNQVDKAILGGGTVNRRIYSEACLAGPGAAPPGPVGVVVALLLIGAVTSAPSAPGICPHAAALVLVACLLGGAVNIPVARQASYWAFATPARRAPGGVLRGLARVPVGVVQAAVRAAIGADLNTRQRRHAAWCGVRSVSPHVSLGPGVPARPQISCVHHGPLVTCCSDPVD